MRIYRTNDIDIGANRMNKREIAEINEQVEQTNNVDVDFGASTIKDNSLVDVSINSIAVKVPKMYLNDNTAIAGGVNPNGTLTFHRCREWNTGKYRALKTPVGIICHNAQFGAKLTEFGIKQRALNDGE